MKRIQLNTFLIFVCFTFSNLPAQGIINKDNERVVSSGFDTNAQELNYFSQQSNEVLSNDNVNVVNTGVFINQIGDNNSSNVATQSAISTVKLNQFGNSNQINLQLKAEVIDYSVIQNGNNNLLLEYNMFNDKQLIQRTVQQNGNNQNLVIHGRNSIVDKMEINMGSGSQSLIIRNTN